MIDTTARILVGVAMLLSGVAGIKIQERIDTLEAKLCIASQKTDEISSKEFCK